MRLLLGVDWVDLFAEKVLQDPEPKYGAIYDRDLAIVMRREHYHAEPERSIDGPNGKLRQS